MKNSIDLLKELVAQRPVSADVAQVNKATEILSEYLSKQNLYLQTETFPDGRKVLFAANAETKTPDVLLNAHVDVVPAEAEQFSPYEENGWLVGRGTSDCLGHAVMIAQILCRAKTKMSVGAFFTADEEIGGSTTKGMLDRGYGAKQLVLVIDGPKNAIACAQKGILSFNLTAKGKAVHSSAPWAGENAIDKLIDAYMELRKLFPEAADEENQWRDTFAAVTFNAGTAHNRVPDVAEMMINIRYTGKESAESILQRIETLSGIKPEVKMSCLPVVFSEETPAFLKLVAAMKGPLGCDIDMVRMNGATDARHFVALGNVPVAIIGADGRGIHGVDEAANIASLKAYEDLLVDFLENFTEE